MTIERFKKSSLVDDKICKHCGHDRLVQRPRGLYCLKCKREIFKV